MKEGPENTGWNHNSSIEGTQTASSTFFIHLTARVIYVDDEDESGDKGREDVELNR